MTLELSKKDYFIDLENKQLFRNELCNIVEMSKSKVANVPTGYKILQPLQSEEEFNKVYGENWAITQTNDSNILFFDLDKNEYDLKLKKFFNRRRDKYINHSELINSKHGFLKVKDADHDWCVKFAGKYHLSSGIEIYAEKHWVIFAGTYYNDKNIDDPNRETKWYSLDDLHGPIIEITKKDLGEVFDSIQFDASINNKTKFEDGLIEGNRNIECFKTACDIFEKRKLDFDSGLNFIKTWNSLSKKPLDDSELERTVKSAWDTVNKTEKSKDLKEIIHNFIVKWDLITPFNTNDIFYRDGVIHRKGIDGILKQEIKGMGMIMKTRDFNDLKFNIGIESQVDYKEPNPFDNNLIGLTNIVLDPVTFEPVETVVYVNSVLNREYRPELIDREDVILKAVKEILGDQYKKYLAICVILLTGKNNIKKFIDFDGPPDSAKTTLLIILESFVVTFTSLHIKNLQEDTKRLAKCNSILNVSEEAESCIKDEEIFKRIIDGSPQQESWKYDKELTTYDPSKVLHVGASNGVPDIRGNRGVAKRMVIIPCKNHFEKDDTFQQKLVSKDNLDRFLLSVIECAKLNETNPLLDMDTDQKTELFEILGDPVGYFKENMMYQEDGKCCLPEDVWNEFEAFKKERGISKEYTPRKFSLVLNIVSKPERIDDNKPVKVYKGWGLVSKALHK